MKPICTYCGQEGHPAATRKGTTMTNFDTVREALAAIADTHVHTYKQALTALAEIERTHYTPEDIADASAQGFRDGVASVTAGQEPEPDVVIRDDAPTLLLGDRIKDTDVRLYRAAPVAQQPRQCGLCGSDEAFTGTCGGGRRDPRALCYEPVAQQPQAEPHKPLFADMIAQHPGLREELKAMDDPTHPLFVQQPQAEAVPLCVECSDQITAHDPGVCGTCFATKYEAAPQQAEAVPSKPVGYVSALALRLFSGSATDHTIRLRHTPSGAEVIPIFTPAPQQAEAVPPDVNVVRKALDRAFTMGQNYWADADSESIRAHKRSDVTRAKFLEMRDEVCAALAAAPKGQQP